MNPAPGILWIPVRFNPNPDPDPYPKICQPKLDEFFMFVQGTFALLTSRPTSPGTSTVKPYNRAHQSSSYFFYSIPVFLTLCRRRYKKLPCQNSTLHAVLVTFINYRPKKLVSVDSVQNSQAKGTNTGQSWWGQTKNYCKTKARILNSLVVKGLTWSMIGSALNFYLKK